MDDIKFTKKHATEIIKTKLSHNFGIEPEEATDEQFYKVLAMIVRDILKERNGKFVKEASEAGSKQIYYISMEFLMGRSLRNNLYNLGLGEVFRDTLKDMGIKLDSVYDCEPDAGLGNGGLGRLAACYLDALASSGYHGMGYSILYEYGIFKQKLVDGWQTELPDFWLPGGEVWLTRREDRVVDIRFEGSVSDVWADNHHYVEHVGYKTVKAIPYDMYVAGKDGRGASVLRLWSAKAPGLDMDMFNSGNYMQAMEENAMAEVISKVLYPSDNHPEGKSLRLRQQYFMVSAAIQDIAHRHIKSCGNMSDLPDKIAIHINDTHPTMAIPEFMRILLDDCGYPWDEAWKLIKGIFAYTNHTVMKEALEVWSEELVKRLLPRIYQIIKEIDNRHRAAIWEETHDADRVERMAIISNGLVHMANLCVCASHSVNGVSALHSEILKNTVFNDFYTLKPEKFKNVTNGIAYRRWLCQANPALCGYIKELIGDGFENDASELEKLKAFADDETVLKEIERIKFENKENFAKLVKKTNGIEIDPNSIFDVQVKRLHEYKRQHLNALNILTKYLEIKKNPGGNFTPHTYIFAAKAAPGYFVAKKIISFICALGDLINNDPDVAGRLKVVYMEDYNVTMAERLMPAADFSEQISLAGTEASGTGNMKLMLNGAITIGTMDGANVEIFEAVGEDNIIIFGMETPDVEELRRHGYTPMNYYNNNGELREVIDFINRGINGKPFGEIGGTIVHYDPYMVLADFAGYRLAQKKLDEIYKNRQLFSRMSLMNTASAGRFSADRAIGEYAKNIWHSKPYRK
jgi:starch phosphorylase